MLDTSRHKRRSWPVRLNWRMKSCSFHTRQHREGRENRPQLRCGNASDQVSTTVKTVAQSQSKNLVDEGRETRPPLNLDLGFQISNFRLSQATNAESEHLTAEAHTSGAIARVGTRNLQRKIEA